MAREIKPASLGVIAGTAACVCLSLMGVVSAANSWAGGCPNETVRLAETNGSGLPDCRAYEQVSPVQKNLADARGQITVVQASPEGGQVTFASIVPFPGVAGSVEFPTYLSTRVSVGSEEWSTAGLEPPLAVGGRSSVIASTEDLAKSVVFSSARPPLAPTSGGEDERGNYYIRDNATGEYQFFAPGDAGELRFVDATPGGSRILFQASAALVNGAAEGAPDLYEWHEGHVALIANDAVGGPTNYEGSQPGTYGEYYTQNTISQNGSRVFFTDLENGKLNVYSRPQGEVLEVSPGSAQWRASTPDGRYVFYTENAKLYRLDVEAAETDRKAGRTLIAEEVIGLLGVSNNGSYAYYATAVENNNRYANIYEWHEGQPTFISLVEKFVDAENWIGRCACNSGGEAAEGEKVARVSASGEDLLITSGAKLTSYENAKQYELYIFHAPTAKLTCVSCNPTGAPATASSFLAHKTLSTASAYLPQFFLTRNLSEDGDRVFFQTEEALVPEDKNNGVDVYEWEREGAGTCSDGSGNGSGGCLYLISPGTSGTAEAYFGNADAEGNNVFFFTRQPLVRQDQDYNSDLYDARVNGGMGSQNVAPEPSCNGEETCRGAASQVPQFDFPSSAVLLGAGNLPTAPELPVTVQSPSAKQKSTHKAKNKRKRRTKKGHRPAKSSRRRHAGRGI